MTSNIQADNIEIGDGTFIHPTAKIKGINGSSKSIKIGDHSYIGENVQIICDDFELGDYCKIHHHTNIHGYKPCKIGHNAWIGQYTIIDCIGGTTIGNNCGIGAHSQLWSHIKYGDTLEGCRFNGENQLNVGNDVWFVGHCIISPITAYDKSMAMVGSVVTKDMAENEIYAGSPAKSISDKIGSQFSEVTLEDKFERLNAIVKESGIDTKNIQIVKYLPETFNNEISYFIVSSREYTKKNSIEEVELMKYLLPEKAKFIPYVTKAN